MNHTIRIILLCIIPVLAFSPLGAREQHQEIAALNQKCKDYWGTNLDTAEYYGKQAVALARKEKEWNDEVARAYMFLAVVYYYVADDGQAKAYVEEGLVVAEQINSDWGRAFAYNLLTIINRMTGDYEASIAYAKKTITLRSEQKDTFNLAGAYNNLGNTYLEMGDLESAIENQLMGLELRMVTNDTSGMVLGHGNVADIYLLMENVALAKEHIDKAIRMTRKGTESHANNLLVLGDIFNTNYEAPDTALVLYKEALAIFLRIGIRDGIGVASENVGSALMRLGQLDDAFSYFQKAEAIYQDQGDNDQLAHVYMNYGDYYSQQKNYKAALPYFNKAYRYARMSQNSKQIQNALESLYRVNKLFGMDKRALAYLEQYKAFADSLNTEEAYGQMAKLETRYKTLEKEFEIKTLKQKQEISQARQRLLVFIIMGLALISALMVFLIQLKRRKDRQIHQQVELVYEKEKELTLSELERSKLKERKLQQGLEYRSKQLSTHALHMMQKNSILQDIQHELGELKSSNVQEVNRKIKALINQSMRSDKDWDTFRHYFEDVNKNFYAKLFEIAPELSVTDQKICALIKLNMDTKQMASVLNVATNSIKSSRYRLKKKLGLEAEVDMEAFIRGID